MSYTKREWATGNVVGAVDLNRIENGIADIDVDEIRGWGVQNTQLFSESVTTVTKEGASDASAEFAYSQQITADAITVSFNGTDYHCNRIDGPMGSTYYGGYNLPSADYSEYPFYIESVPIMGVRNAFHTETAGTYTVAVSTETAEVSDNFSVAVDQCVDTSTMPMLCVNGVTTYNEMRNARNMGRLMYFYTTNHDLCIVASMDNSPFLLISALASISADFDENNLFTITNE